MNSSAAGKWTMLVLLSGSNVMAAQEAAAKSPDKPATPEVSAPVQAAKPTAAQVPANGPVKAAPATESSKVEASVKLDPFSVVAPTAKPKAPELPRSSTPTVEDHHVELGRFDTPGFRDEKLQQKHLTALDRNFLNRFSLPGSPHSASQRAKDAEARLQSAEATNNIADLIAALEASGASKDEIKEMKKLYYQLLANRPR